MLDSNGSVCALGVGVGEVVGRGVYLPEQMAEHLLTRCRWWTQLAEKKMQSALSIDVSAVSSGYRSLLIA